ncbi:MAG: sulfatase-like hydrolase/transferase [Coraliomargaritaceae bacterium]
MTLSRFYYRSKFSLLFALATALSSLPAKAMDRPNVVLFLLDDVSHYSVSAYGAQKISCDLEQGSFENVPFATPRMDRLADEGVRCNWAFTYPLCEPTRIALMSGKNNRRNFLQPKAQHASDITFGDLFKRAGYATGLVGKWKQARGTKEIRAEDYIFEFGWDEFFAFDVNNRVGRRMIEPNFVLNGEIKNYRGIDPETGRRWYGPDLINRYALDFIERKKDNPFFLYYSMVLMHTERTPTPDTRPKDIYDNYDVNRKGNGRLVGDDPRFYPDMLHYADKMIGNLLDKLEETGLAENTIVILMGDNGTRPEYFFTWPDGVVRQAYKGKHIEGGIQVPLLIRAPGKIPANTEYEGLVYITDLLPMICEATGVEIPNRKDMDGVSFWPQLIGQSKEELRDSITTWYRKAGDFLEYAFDKRFKRYAPDVMYPDGRFFEWSEDPLEEAGAPVKKKIPNRWNRFRYAGLDLNNLNPEQQAAYDRLGDLLKAHRYVPVERLSVIKSNEPLRVGKTQQLTCKVYPANATRNNVIWKSNNPMVASVDKFGVLHAHKAGEVTVHAYSWDDANPSALGKGVEFSTNGMTHSVNISVSN